MSERFLGIAVAEHALADLEPRKNKSRSTHVGGSSVTSRGSCPLELCRVICRSARSVTRHFRLKQWVCLCAELRNAPKSRDVPGLFPEVTGKKENSGRGCPTSLQETLWPRASSNKPARTEHGCVLAGRGGTNERSDSDELEARDRFANSRRP